VVARAWSDPAYKQRLLTDADPAIASSMKRPGKPEDAAAACAYLASEEAGYITGQTLSVMVAVTSNDRGSLDRRETRLAAGPDSPHFRSGSLEQSARK
jgi:NAD(P)-dependent dehydrogenase (short-subunit alcohol dehydrogenase family)